jgi:hypothetical protein
MPGAPGVAKEFAPGCFDAKVPPKGLFVAPPKTLPPPNPVLAPPKEPNPVPEDVVVVEGVAAGEANELSLGALPKGDPDLAAAANPPKGDALELARLPNPEALNLSSDVWGRPSVFSEVLGGAGFAAMAAKGDAAEVFAKPLPAGMIVAGLGSSLSRTLLDSRSSAFVAA